MSGLPIRELADGRWEFRADTKTPSGKRKQVRRTFATKTETKNAYVKFLSGRNDGTSVAPERITVEMWMNLWITGLRDDGAALTTVEGYEQLCALYIYHKIGKIQLQQLTEDDVAGVLRGMAKRRLSKSTMQSVKRRINTAMNLAVRQGRLAKNPAKFVAVPTALKPPREHIILNDEQLALLLPVLHADRLSGLWLLELATGVRRGELMGLRWDAVDLSAATIAIRRNRTTTPKGTVVDTERTKTDSSRRVIPLAPQALVALKAWKAAQAAERLRLGERWKGGDYVFTTQDGTLYSPSSPTKMLKRLCKRAGVPQVPLHHMRHGFATMALKTGVDVKVLSNMLGHSKVATTQDLYQHVDMDMKRNAIDAIGAAFGV